MLGPLTIGLGCLICYGAGMMVLRSFKSFVFGTTIYIVGLFVAMVNWHKVLELLL